MRTFKDTAGREWLVKIDVATVKRVRDVLDLDLLKIDGADSVFAKLADPVTLVDVLYVVCLPQATEASVSDESFGGAMGGDVLDAASSALIEDLIDFFPSARRPILRRAWEKIQEIEGKAIAAVTERLNSPELDKAINDILKPGNLSGDSPG